MSPDALTAYVTRLFAQEDPVLTTARRRHEERGLPEIYISPDEGRLLAVLLKAVGARRVLEIGTLGGYSGIWIVRALPPDGLLTTIEREPAHARSAREAFEAAGVAARVELLEGEARDILPGLTPGFDAVFVDADKESLESYYREGMRLLRPGGLLLCDNAFYHGRVLDPADTKPDVEGVRAFNALAARDPDLQATILPVRDGLLLGVKAGPS